MHANMVMNILETDQAQASHSASYKYSFYKEISLSFHDMMV